MRALQSPERIQSFQFFLSCCNSGKPVVKGISPRCSTSSHPLLLPLIYYRKLVFLTLVGLEILELKLPGYPK